MSRRRIYPEKPDDQPPVCPHCDGTDLKPHGSQNGRRRFQCRACNRSSFGVRPAHFLKCPTCLTKLGQQLLPDGRTLFRCFSCGKHHMSAYIRSPRKKKEDTRCRHVMTLSLDRHARAGLVEYVQAKRCTDAQAVRAIFRYVLSGEVFGSPITSHEARMGRRRSIAIPRNPQAAAMEFPDLRKETARKALDRSKGYSGRGFQATVLSVGKIIVNLDDEAKEGLVYTMNRLQMNHADAARWLLANVRVPGAELAVPIRTLPPPNTFVVCSGRRISAEITGNYGPRWDDD